MNSKLWFPVFAFVLILLLLEEPVQASPRPDCTQMCQGSACSQICNRKKREDPAAQPKRVEKRQMAMCNNGKCMMSGRRRRQLAALAESMN